MVEKSVKIFSIRMGEIQECIEVLKREIVYNILSNFPRDGLSKAQWDEMKTIATLIDEMSKNVDKMRMLWK